MVICEANEESKCFISLRESNIFNFFDSYRYSGEISFSENLMSETPGKIRTMFISLYSIQFVDNYFLIATGRILHGFMKAITHSSSINGSYFESNPTCCRWRAER